MGSRGERHLSRIAAPKTWALKKRKRPKWITRPMPGPHRIGFGMPLSLILIHILRYANNSKEAKQILNNKQILIDAKRRKNPKYPVGIFDTISIPLTNEHYRMLFNTKGKLFLKPIEKAESRIKPCKVVGKRNVKGGAIQLSLHDGRTLLTKDKEIKIGDTLLIELPSQKIRERFKLEQGACAFLISGMHIGKLVRIEEIKDAMLVCKTKSGILFETPKQKAIIVGKEKPAIALD